MTIDFNTIKVHDLVYIKGRLHYRLKSCYVEGWHIVNGIKETRIGVKPLGKMDWEDIGIFNAEDTPQVVQNHIRAAAVPGAIEALQQIASGKLIVEGEERDAPESLQKTLGVNAQRVKDIYLVGPDNSALFAVIAVRLARDALRAVRGEESA